MRKVLAAQKSPAGAGKLEWAEELAGVKRPPARARLPVLGPSFGGCDIWTIITVIDCTA